MLPSDCIASLLRHLPTPDLARTGLACRQHHEAVASVLRLRIKESGLYLPPVLPQSPTATMNLLLRLEQGRADAQGRAAAHAAARAAALETGRQERLAALHRLETAILTRLKQWRASGPAPPGVAFRITDGFGIIQRLRDEREDEERRASLAAAATMRSRVAALEVEHAAVVEACHGRIMDLALVQQAVGRNVRRVREGVADAVVTEDALSDALLTKGGELMQISRALLVLESESTALERDATRLLRQARNLSRFLHRKE